MIWGHAGLPWVPGAYLFIDTFFVISGFLVCKSFLRLYERAEQNLAQRPAGKFQLLFWTVAAFYDARVRRIAIPLGATVLLTLAAGWYILLPDDLVELATSARATLFLYAHIHALTLGNYFDVVNDHSPLLHTWSLSLEEWFYIVTPCLVIPALIWQRRVWLVVLILVTAASLYTAQTLSSDPDALGASYSMFDTRLWEFSTGVIFALVFVKSPDMPGPVNDMLLVAGITLVFASVLFLNSKAASPGYITMPVVIGTLTVLVIRPCSDVVSRATRSRFAAFFGRRLYSLYLAHYPFIVLFDYVGFQFVTGTDLAKFVLAIIFSLGFYSAFEAPMQGWRRVKLLYIVTISVVLFGSSLALTGYIDKTGGATERMPPDALLAWTARFNTNPMRAECLAGELSAFGYSCAIGDQDGPYVALMGDSHSDALANQMAGVLTSQGLGLRHYWYSECPVIGSGVVGLGVFSAECEKLAHEAHAATLRDRKLAGVIYVMRWPWYLADPGKDTVRAYWRGFSGIPRGYEDMPEFRADFTKALAASIRAYAARGIRVYLVRPVPEVSEDPVKEHALALWYGSGSSFESLRQGVKLRDHEKYNEYFDAVVSDLRKQVSFKVLDVRPSLCDDTHCYFYGPEGSLYYDGHHLNEFGAKRVATGLLAQLKRFGVNLNR